MCSPDNKRADEASLGIGNELGKTNIVEIENSPNNRMYWKTKTGV